MAFNGGFPATYQPMYYQPQYQTVQPSYVQQNQQPAQQNNSIIWVSGEAGAKAYLVAPNTTVQLWDSEAQVIYLKSADASGMPSMKILDYTIRDMTPANGPVAASPAPTINAQDYALRTDLDALAAQITALKAQIEKKGASVNE
jgi:hypothetical protein